MSVASLFDAVRSACSPGAWSRGVDLVRGDAVIGESESDAEITLRVSTRGGLVCPGVHLYPEDDDWECECASRDPACEHVAAAVIALRQGLGSATAKPGGGPGRIGYRLTRTPQGISLDRVVVSGDQSTPLRSTLAALASGRIDGPPFVATRADLEIERTLGSRLRGDLPRGLISRVFARLAECPDVQLDGRPIRVSPEPVLPRGRLVEEDGGFRLFVGRDPTITELIEPGLALCGDTLRSLGETRLTGRELEELGRGRLFSADDVAELVTEILPSLRARIPVDVASGRLPRTVREKPRLCVEVRRERNRLSALATLVYGDPPIARVDAGKLVSLGGPVPIRDEAEEARLVRQLQRELSLLPGRRMLHAGEEALRFAEQLQRFGGEVRGDAHLGFHRAPALEAKLGLDASGLEVSFSAGGDPAARRVDAASVLRAWRDGDSLVALPDGGFAPLPVDWLERFGHRVSDLLAARDDRGALPACALPDLARLCDALDAPRPPAYEALRAMVERHADIPAAPLPDDLRGTLRRYQQHGVDWMCLLRDAGLGALLADDMGLGKTLQALCALRGRTLVVAPTSVVHNWASEIERFRPGLRARVYHGPGRRLDPKADVTLTSYAILRLDADALGAEAWDTLILDEAQLIKNPDSQVARAAHRLKAEFRLALSGTPVENRLTELWSVFRVINPGLLGARSDFGERYEKPIDRGDADAADRLRERIHPFVLRRLKREVAPELPPRTEVVLHAELSDDERELYDAVRAATRRDLVDQLDGQANVLQALEALLRLRQAACHPALVPGGRADRSSKTDVLLELLDEAVADGHKVVVFSQWTSLLDLLEPLLRSQAIGFTRLDGATRDRAAVVSQFQDPDGPPVLIASLRAGGVGLNLTAADHVVIFDPWWNPAAEDQAADRAHRIGQTRPVMVYRLVARDTVEERILALQQRKRALADTALGGAERAGSVTREDLLALLA